MDLDALENFHCKQSFQRGWTDDTDCKLCTSNQENPVHLCKNCSFTKEVWGIIKQWFNLSILDSVNTARSLHAYWWRCRRKLTETVQGKVDGIFIYFQWNIQKERNRRIFQNTSIDPMRVVALCKDDITQYRLGRLDMTTLQFEGFQLCFVSVLICGQPPASLVGCGWCFSILFSAGQRFLQFQLF